MEAQARCKTHPKVAAGWTCNWCHAPLCPDCVALQFAARTTVEQCCLCGGQASRILRKRSDKSYLQRLPGALAFPLSKSGLVTIVVVGLFVYFLRLLGLRGALIAQAILWTYVFGLIRSASLGKTEIEPPDITSLADLFGPAFHCGVATMIIWVPALIYGIWVRPAIWPEPPMAHLTMGDLRADPRHPGTARMPPGMMPPVPNGLPAQPGAPAVEPGEDDPDTPPDEASPDSPTRKARAAQLGAHENSRSGPPPIYRDPFLWLLLILGVLYAPMALTLAAAGGSWIEMLNPVRIVQAILRIPGDYLVLVAAAGALALMMGFASILGSLIDRIPIPIVPGWIAGMLSTYPALVTGKAFGLLLYVRGTDLGYLPPDDAFESSGDGVTPRGTPPSAVSAQPAPAAPEPAGAPAVSSIAARFGPGPEATAPEAAPAPAHDRYAPIALDSEPEPPAAQPVPLVQALQQALATKDLAQVVALYAAATEPLPAALHFEAGRAAAVAVNNPLALRAFKTFVQLAPQDPLAPKALVMAARIYGERLGDAATAAKIYAHVVAKYPGTEAATFAQQRLGATAPAPK